MSGVSGDREPGTGGGSTHEDSCLDCDPDTEDLADDDEGPTQTSKTPPPQNRDLSDWICAAQWSGLARDFREGDIIEFYRAWRFTNHWAVYVGGGLVAHVTIQECPWVLRGSSSSAIRSGGTVLPAETNRAAGVVFSAPATCIQLGLEKLYRSPPVEKFPSNEYFVRLDPLVSAAQQDLFRINNSVRRAGDRVVRSFEDIFRLLKEELNEPYKYSLMRNNCRHFAYRMRYGQAAEGTEG